MADLSLVPCDPFNFYDKDEDTYLSQMEEDYLRNVLFGITCIFQGLAAPFVIILPFFNNRLNSTTRKVVAMIVLSDFIYSILCLQQIIRRLVGNDPKGDVSCLTVTFAYDIFVTCSLIWTCLLLVNIYIHSAHLQTMPSTRRLFVIYNFISWPAGILLSFPSYLEAVNYPITYRANYLFDVGCHLNFTFSEKSDDCLINKDGEYTLDTYYGSRITIILLIWALFFLSVRRAHLNWLMSDAGVQRTQSSKLENAGHKVARETAYKTYRNCLKFVVPAFVYSAAFVPIFIKQLYAIEFGAIENSYIRTAYVIWFAWSGLFVACMNVLFYGYGSSIFREEVRNLWHRTVFYCEVRFRNRNRGASSWHLQQVTTPSASVNRFSSDSENPHASASNSLFTETELNY